MSHPFFRSATLLALSVLATTPAFALEKPERTYQVFQFPADRIPRIDGDTSDWDIVPVSYVITQDELIDDKGRHPQPDPENLAVRVRVGWVQGLNRLYFLYEAADNYWDYSLPSIHNDTFEIVVDGDASGGPLIAKDQPRFWNRDHVGESAARPDARITDSAARWAIHSVHAQNYHIFTPPGDKAWCMAWGTPTWVKEFPWANSVCRHAGRPGEAGPLVLEFWITPFDYAGPEGPERAIPSVLTENKIIGLAWAVIDYDDVDLGHSDAFWNLSPKHTMYGDASELCAFRLMPLEPALRPASTAEWTWSLVDPIRRRVAFTDKSTADAHAWKWTFGDGASSTEQHPSHHYSAPGVHTVALEITTASGTARKVKVAEVPIP